MLDRSLKNIKDELKQFSQEELLEFTARIIRSKKENKELAAYILFEQDREDEYAQKLIDHLNAELEDINYSRPFIAKKSIRRVNRLSNRYLKYSGNTETALKVTIFLAEKVTAKSRQHRLMRHTEKIIEQYLTKYNKLLSGMHEDLQYDYQNVLNDFKKNTQNF